ncbi:MAG: AMP-binding protein, partial [Bacillales bacterium]
MAELVQLTIGQLLEEKAQELPDHDALVYVNPALRMTYREFNEHCRNIAKGLMALGIEKGEHVALWATNKPEWVSLQFATGKMGAVLVTVNINYRAAELEYLLKHSDASTIILMEQYRDHSY